MRKEDSYQQGDHVMYYQGRNIIACKVVENRCNKNRVQYSLKAIAVIMSDTFNPSDGEVFPCMKARRTGSKGWFLESTLN